MSLKSEDPNYYAHQYNWMDQTGQDKKKIRILDSTLREGEQHPGVSFTIKQRIQIAWMLDSFGVDQIKISREEAKIRALEVADYIKAHGMKARFTMEDASRTEPQFLLEMCKDMNKCGIERISIPDTVGIMRPLGMYNLVKMVYDNIDTTKTSIDVHCHNDVGLALANALAGCEAGADQIHTTIDGF